MISIRKLFHPFTKPTAATLALAELEDARREYLAACSGQEYATAMKTYNAQRIARLEKDLAMLAGTRENP